jgi:hypothetical protein
MEAATWFDMLATAGGMPRKTSTGSSEPAADAEQAGDEATSAPSATRSRAFTDTSAMGR